MTSTVRLQEAFKFALAMTLAYWVALAFDWALPKYAALAVVLISLDTTGASLKKGVARVVGTLVAVPIAWWMVGAFFDDRWAFMSVMAVHLAVCAFVMQRSRVPYAWFVTGFVPLVVWLNSYDDPGNAFRFGVFRFLETVTGVLIWTMIAALLWPRRAGDQVLAKGAQFWAAAGDLLAASARRLDPGASADGAAAEANLGAILPALRTAIGAAALDTPAVHERRGAWTAMTDRLDRLATALELHRLAVLDVCDAGAADHAAPAAPLHRALGLRLQRLDRRWGEALRPGAASGDSGGAPEHGPSPDLAAADVPREGRLALAVLSSRLTELDAATRSVEAALSAIDAPAPPRQPEPAAAPSAWDARRFGLALLPAVCFLLGCVVWILTDPPTGVGIPEFAGILSLMTLTFPDRRMLRQTVFALLKGLACCVPVYFLVMPWLGGGPGLFVVIFLFSGVFGWLGVTNPTLRLGAMAMFATTTGISNEQTYSFLTFANSATMLLLAGGIALLVYGFFTPARPGRDLTDSVRLFFATCVRVLDRTSGASAAELGAPLAAARAAYAGVDPAAAPGNSSERVDRLFGAMQTLTLRLAALDTERAQRHYAERTAVADATEALSRAEADLGRVLESLSRGEPGAPLDCAAGALDDAHDALAASHPAEDDLAASRDGYAYLGTTRGVLAATTAAQGAVAELDWDRWQEARFA